MVADLNALEQVVDRVRAAARQAVRDAEKVVQALGDPAALSEKQARRRIMDLENALVEVKKHHAIAVADQVRLTQLALEAPLEIQRGVVEEMNAAVTRLHAAVLNAQWNLQVHKAQGPDTGAVAQARAALETMRGHAAKAEALTDDALGRGEAKVVARLDQQMRDVKMCVAVTIADEKRFRAAAGENGPDDHWLRSLRPPDAETMARVLAAQAAAVEDLKRQLGAVNDRVEGVKRRARIEAAKRKLGK